MKQIIAIGGGGFGRNPGEGLIEQYILDQTGKNKPNICFIPTATGDNEAYKVNYYTTFSKLDCNPVHLDFFKRTPDLEKLISEQDAIFVGGGNTFLLLNKLYQYSLIDILKNKINSGIPYLGTSAGSNICGMTIGTTNDMPIIHVKSLEALGIIDFNINPHYLDPIDGFEHMGESRETRINEFHKFNDQFVIGLREGSYLQVEGDDIYLKGLKHAVIFKKENEKFEIENGFNLKNII